MTNQFFAYGFGVPVVLFFLNLGIFLALIRLRGPLGRPFKEIRAAWLTFMRQGIPIPADYKRFDYGIVGKGVLRPVVFDPRRSDSVAR